MGRSNKNVVEGPALKRVERIIECLRQGCSDAELAIKIRNVGMPIEVWGRHIKDRAHLARVHDVERRYRGRKVEETFCREPANV